MVKIDQKKCDRLISCAASRICPVQAIKPAGNVVGFRVEKWEVDEEKCLGCQVCVSACPHQAIGSK